MTAEVYLEPNPAFNNLKICDEVMSTQDCHTLQGRRALSYWS